MTHSRTRFSASLVLLTLGLIPCFACDPPDLTPTSEVIRLRVLAMETDPAEIEFGDTVTVEPVIADPWNEGYSVQWMPCIETSLGGFTACDFENMLVDLTDPFAMAGLTAERLQFTVDQQVVFDMMAERDPIDRSQGLALQFMLLLLPRGKTLFDYMPEFDVSQAENEAYIEQYGVEASEAMGEVFEALIRQSRIAYKRVLVSDFDSLGIANHTEGECLALPGIQPNSAPSMGGIIERVEGLEYAHPSGAQLTVVAGESVELRPLWNTNDREIYYHVNWAGETECRAEEPFFGWYATAGSFASAEGYATDYSGLDAAFIPQNILWNAPDEIPEHNPVQGWVVVWDRRGGMDHIAVNFFVE